MASRAQRFKQAIERTATKLRRDNQYVVASDSLIDSRRELCGVCKHKKHHTCMICGCRLPIMLVLEDQHCHDTPQRW